MKHPTLHTVLFFSILFLALSHLVAFGQKEAADNLITVKITHTDGTVTVLKKRGGTQEEVQDMMSSFGRLDGSSIREVQVTKGSQSPEQIELDQDQLIYIRTATEREVDMDIEVEIDQDESERKARAESFMRSRSPRGSTTKPFVGVYLGGSRAEGVRISGVVAGSGAEKAGLEGDDIITSMDGISVAGEQSLSKALDQFEPGQSVTVGYLRKGREGFTEVTLTSKGYRYAAHYEENPCKVFIGVYTSNFHGGGVDVRGVINSTPAFKSGVKPGDVILAMDGIQVNTHQELLKERNKHELGDYFTLDINREGQFMQIESQFPSCNEIEEASTEEAPTIVEEVIIQDEAPAAREEAAPLEEQRIGELNLLDYQVFPNPTISYVNVRFQGEAKPMRLQLVNNTGQVVYEDIQNQFDGIYNKRLNLEGLATGTYYIRVIQENKVKTEPLIVVPRV